MESESSLGCRRVVEQMTVECMSPLLAAKEAVGRSTCRVLSVGSLEVEPGLLYTCHLSGFELGGKKGIAIKKWVLSYTTTQKSKSGMA